MKLTTFYLKKNALFKGADHPYIISFKEFALMNKKVFVQITLKELDQLMPYNPKRMHGARGDCALAQAVFDFYSIKTIIPSDVGLIHGVVKYDFK